MAEKEKRCQVITSDGSPCGRVLHDKEFCFLHSPKEGRGADIFQNELNKIFNDKSLKIYDFTGFIFPDGILFPKIIDKKIIFFAAGFRGMADFGGATFNNEADFRLAVFEKSGIFSDTTFYDKVYFSLTFFKGLAEFTNSTFYKGVSFEKAFIEDILIVDEEGKNKIISKEEVDFRHVEFLHPEKVRFRKVDLSKFRFSRTDLRKVEFIDVEWYRKSKKKGINKIYDEIKTEPGMKKFDYSLIAQTYKRLRANYEENLYYAEAGDFFIGEMDMRRKGEKNIINKIFLCLYKFFSHYGESFRRPLGLMALLLLTFPLLYMIAGIAPSEKMSGDGIQRLINYEWDFCFKNMKLSSEMWDDYKSCLLYSISAMSLVREKPFYPSYFSGYALTILEYILMVVFISFFILALRRRFRR
jgi:uncharacterized protein YjbI with pentapeptide repeats